MDYTVTCQIIRPQHGNTAKECRVESIRIIAAKDIKEAQVQALTAVLLSYDCPLEYRLVSIRPSNPAPQLLPPLCLSPAYSLGYETVDSECVLEHLTVKSLCEFADDLKAKALKKRSQFQLGAARRVEDEIGFRDYERSDYYATQEN